MDVSPPRLTQIDCNEHPDFNDSIGYALTDARRGWVAADEPLRGDQGLGLMHVWQTVDGGAHWRESHFRTYMVGDSVYLQFVDPRNGVLLALGDPAAGMMPKEFYRTNDGGQTWRHMTSPDQAGGSFYPTGMTFRTPNDGWVTATYHGEPDAPFLHTTDGGQRWHQEQLPIPTLYRRGGYANTYPPQFFGIRRRTGVELANLVNNYSRRGEIAEQGLFLTHDGGSHWRMGHPLPITGDSYGQAASFFDTLHEWVLDQQGKGLYATQDGGLSWRLVTTHIGPRYSRRADVDEDTELDFVSPKIGWALVTTSDDDRQRATLYQTQDGGRHWGRVYTAAGVAPSE